MSVFPLSVAPPALFADHNRTERAMSAPSPAGRDQRQVATAIVYCEANFGAIDGKTANGLVRHSEKYEILSVIDSEKAGLDAGVVLDPFQRRSGRCQNPSRCRGDFRADAVTRDENDLMRCHVLLPAQE